MYVQWASGMMQTTCVSKELSKLTDFSLQRLLFVFSGALLRFCEAESPV